MPNKFSLPKICNQSGKRAYLMKEEAEETAVIIVIWRNDYYFEH